MIVILCHVLMDQSWFLYRVLCDVVVGFLNICWLLLSLLIWIYQFLPSFQVWRQSWCNLTLAVKCCACVASFVCFPTDLYCGLDGEVFLTCSGGAGGLCVRVRVCV